MKESSHKELRISSLEGFESQLEFLMHSKNSKAHQQYLVKDAYKQPVITPITKLNFCSLA